MSSLIAAVAHRLREETRRDAVLLPTGEVTAGVWRPAEWVTEHVQFKQGEGPTGYQLDAMRTLGERRRLALRGPHGLGKTALTSWVILSFCGSFDGTDWKVVTTASVWRQLTAYLWPEVHKWAPRVNWRASGRAPIVDQSSGLLQFMIRGKTGQAFAVASNDHQKIEGAHADHILYVVDEAKTVPPATWDAIEGALAGGDAYVLACSTPGEPAGRFYEICSRKPGYEDWATRWVTKEEVIKAGRMSARWAEQRRKQWGEKSEVYLQRVCGEFAAADSKSLIRLAWVEAANERWHQWKAELAAAYEVLRVALALSDEDAEKRERVEAAEKLVAETEGWDALGVDVAREGTDATVIADVRRRGVLALHKYQALVTGEVVGETVRHLGARKAEAPVICDVIGNGAGVVDGLREANVWTTAFNAGESTQLKDRTGELTFRNKRSAAWWLLREKLDPDYNSSWCLPPDDELTGDLTAPHWRVTGKGVIEVEAKDSIRTRLGRSTDCGDAVMMGNWPERDMPAELW
jgi:hypothetical protein